MRLRPRRARVEVSGDESSSENSVDGEVEQTSEGGGRDKLPLGEGDMREWTFEAVPVVRHRAMAGAIARYLDLRPPPPLPPPPPRPPTPPVAPPPTRGRGRPRGRPPLHGRARGTTRASAQARPRASAPASAPAPAPASAPSVPRTAPHVQARASLQDFSVEEPCDEARKARLRKQLDELRSQARMVESEAAHLERRYYAAMAEITSAIDATTQVNR